VNLQNNKPAMAQLVQIRIVPAMVSVTQAAYSQ
jgi:hypothetical protein